MTRPVLRIARKMSPSAARIARLRQAIRLYSSEYASRELNRANRIAWLRAVDRLGPLWVYAVPVPRKERQA